MSTVLNSHAPVFTRFAPAPGSAAGTGARIGRSLKHAATQTRLAVAAGVDVVADGDLHGVLEAVTLVAVIASTAVFTLAAFGVPVGLD